MTTITLNQSIPDFTASATDGTTHSDFQLSAQAGKPLLLYFYPKDSTPGCTTEAQEFTAHAQAFAKLGARIVGVSRDSLKSHDNFIAKQSLNFSLIADPDEALCTLFGVMKMKNMYGKQVRGVERSTFLIDVEGKLAREWRGVKVAGHVEEVLTAVKAL